jgi:mannose-6-phosphate isomerase-like protein (cupin superfamily)
MNRESKIWGMRWLLRKDSVSAASLLELNEGHRCSWHRHQMKYNLFFVISGKIGIVTEELGGVKKETILKDNGIFTVRPGQWHEFRIYADSVVIEIMYVEYDEGDIERKTLGGQIEVSSSSVKSRPNVPVPPSPAGGGGIQKI